MTDLTALVDDVLEGLNGKPEQTWHDPETWGKQDCPDDLADDTRGDADHDADAEHDGDLTLAAPRDEGDGLTEVQRADLESAKQAAAHFRSYQDMLNEELKEVVWLGITDAGVFTRSGKRRAKRKLAKAA